jgi:hypothetical protein
MLQVFDRGTMAPITTLHVSSSTTFGTQRCRIVQNPIARRVYVVETRTGEPSGALAQLYSFETPR